MSSAESATRASRGSPMPTVCGGWLGQLAVTTLVMERR